MSRNSAPGFAQYHHAELNWNRWTAVLGVVLLGAMSVLAQTSGRANRISQDLSAKPMVELSGTVHPLTAKAIDLGAVNSNLQLNSLALSVAPSVAQIKEIESLQVAQQNPESPLYHKWLTQAEYGALFGLTDADLGQLTSWLRSQGFIVKDISASRNAISFSGKVWQVESALHTQLHHYNLDGETHFANASVLLLPAQFAGVVLSVRGLDDFRPKANTQLIPVTPDYTIQGGHYLSPADWATIYNINPIYSAGFDGTGTHVGVVGQTYAPQSDIDNFRAASGLSATQLNYACIGGSGTTLTPLVCKASTDISTGDLSEADLDIEWAGGIAKNATVDYIYVSGADQTNGVFDALAYAITDYKTADGSVLPVVSMSYSSCEATMKATDISLIGKLGQQASLQGQTLVVSSGDSGAAGCDAHGEPLKLQAIGGLSVEVPADSPNFTAVGGTILSGDASTPTLYWHPQLGLVNSAIQYIPETTWNETNSINGIGASGGGESAIPIGGTLPWFPQPTWQNGLIPGTTGRLVPDVAFAAAAGHDGYLNCSSDSNSATYGTMCAKGFYSSGGTVGSTFYSAGGTSAAAPSFAGMLALLVQRYGALGNINPLLYSLAKNPTTYAAVFHDITTDSSDVACLAGTTGCISGLIGYSATIGYDRVTGLGSINGGGLYGAMGGASSFAVTTTTVSALPNPLTIGGTTTLSATVVSITTGTITGTVTFKVGGTSIGTATVSGGNATLSNVIVSTANGFSVGSDSITASFSGDGSYAPSTSPNATLAVAGLTATSTTVSASPNSLAVGGTAMLTASVASTIPGAITGTVTFKVGSTTIGMATVSGGTATSNVIMSTANGFTVSSYSIAAIYSGDAIFAPSTSPSTTLMVVPAVVPTYTFNTGPTSLSGSSNVVLTLNSSGYAGTVSFATSVSSTNATTSNLSATAPSITLTSDGTGTSTLAVTAGANAANHAPGLPWKSGGVVVFAAVLIGAPFTMRRKRVFAVVLTALAISLTGILLACGGFFVGTGITAKSARVYTVLVTPTGSGTVINPAAVSFTVTVP